MSKENHNISEGDQSLNSETNSPPTSDTSDESSQASQTEQQSTEEKKSQDEKVQIDESAATRIRKITERRTAQKFRKEIDKLTAENEALKTKNQSVQTSQAQPTGLPPDTDSYWDQTLGMWINRNISIDEYANIATKRLNQLGQFNQPTQTAATQSDQANQSSQSVAQAPKKDLFTENAQAQAIECDVDFPDFIEVFGNSPLTTTMINAAATNPNGLKNLYLKMKENPNEIYEIARLDPENQRQKVWELNQEMGKKKPKIVSKATPQPAPTNTGGRIHKNEDDMSIPELRALRRQQELERYK